MSPYVERIDSDERLPESADVVIVGGGIVGVSAAYFLARQGKSVALIEKGHIACEQSSRNWGWCRQQNRDYRELPLSSVSMRLWDEFSKELDRDVGFRRCGLFYATDNEAQLAEWAEWQPYGLENGVDTRMLSAAEIARHIPEGSRKWIGGVSSPNDGKAEPALAAPAIALGARAHGATIHQGCAARSLDITNGRVVGVNTEQGLIKADAVLCSAGAWASRFLRPHGINFPQAGVRQTAIRTKPIADVGGCLYAPGFSMTRRLDGSYTLAISGKATIDLTPQGIRYAREFLPQFKRRLKNVRLAIGPSFVTGPESLFALLRNDETIFERTRVLDPEPQQWLVRRILANVARSFPQFAGIELAGAWGALVDCSPDAVPVISKTEQVEGLVLAAGCSGHGFGMGPGIGLLAAQLLANDTPCVDATPFRLSRLVDGSPLEIGGL
ncbi:FAD-binding oxidoreductase [Novosphingobium sp. KN65.2]|uniref:NAD(P)/FAD-dependent oxidoreductase n=1 Tax=Novosphingobium sp. KN65.2 TaxID=1478134 RepID=UPI0005E1B165|nr:FAD-binding oxidoreductase [Novosphingobium sp. KN65.2]CDO34907.1 FAD dependent oxidoreductase [Novosphingobium sp. KN65.2]